MSHRTAPTLLLLALGLRLGPAIAETKPSSQEPTWHWQFNATLALVAEQEPNNTCPGQLIHCGDIVDPARIDTPGDVDWYQFTVTAGNPLTIGTDVADQCNPDLDGTMLALYGSDCSTLLAQDYDSGPGLYSLILNYAAPYTGTYNIKINHYTGATGCYKLFVVCGSLPAGACCLSGGACQVTTQDQCGATGGVYQGDATVCSPNPCPLPPVNDRCDGALTIHRCTSGNLEGTTWHSVNDYVDAMSCTAQYENGRDVTYKMDLRSGDAVNMTYTNFSADGGFYIVTDCANTGGTCVVGADQVLWGQPETIHWVVPQTRTYYLILDAWDWGAGGDYVLNYSITCPTADADGADGFPAVVLDPAAPNPFDQSTTIRFSLPQSDDVRIEIFDASGRLVRELLNASVPSGASAVEWDGQDGAGHRVAPGSYYCRLVSRNGSRTQVLAAVR